MRKTVEILSDLKKGKDVSYEELKMACLVQSFLLHQYKNDVKNLFIGGVSSEMTEEMFYSDEHKSSKELGISTYYWNGMHSDPYDFLSKKDIPNTEEWNKIHKKE